MTDKPDFLQVFHEIPYGFAFGSLEVTRIARDKYFGTVIEVKTKREAVMIRVTPGGYIRLEPVKRSLDRRRRNKRAPDYD